MKFTAFAGETGEKSEAGATKAIGYMCWRWR
jgi:hypothetical protein